MGIPCNCVPDVSMCDCYPSARESKCIMLYSKEPSNEQIRASGSSCAASCGGISCENELFDCEGLCAGANDYARCNQPITGGSQCITLSPTINVTFRPGMPTVSDDGIQLCCPDGQVVTGCHKTTASPHGNNECAVLPISGGLMCEGHWICKCPGIEIECGPADGSCPPGQTLCGENCCSSGQQCLGGQCCNANKVCGTICCQTTENCITDSAGNQGCGICPYPLCGGRCCGPEEMCLNDSCTACPPSRQCGIRCCPPNEECDLSTGECSPICPPPRERCGAECCHIDTQCITNQCCPMLRACHAPDGSEICCAADQVCQDGTTCVDLPRRKVHIRE